MDEIEALRAISTDDHTPAIDRLEAVGGIPSAPKGGRPYPRQRSRTSHGQAVEADDEVILSAVAQVSLLEEQGKSVTAIAANLGLTADEVLSDEKIAAEIFHPAHSALEK